MRPLRFIDVGQTPLRIIARLAVAWCAVILAECFVDAASDADEPAFPGAPLIPEVRPFDVEIQLNSSQGVYRVGDLLEATIKAERSAHLYLLYHQATGETLMVYPNRARRDSRVAGGQAVRVPGEGERFRFRISPPVGEEFLQVLAAPEPLGELASLIRDDQDATPVPAAVLGQLAQRLEAAPQAWTERHASIHTKEKDVPIAPQGPGKRWGVFVGVGKHRFSGVGDPAAKAAESAAALYDALTRRAQLDEARLLLDESAKRSALEETITRWLPQVSQPGDTIYLYITAAVRQIKTNAGPEENDGLDEALVPYDGDWGEGTAAERDAAARRTMITDDTLAEWLRPLRDRKVFLILETYNAADCVDQPASPAPGGAFALLAATDSPKSMWWFGGKLGDLQWFTAALLQAAQQADSAASVQDVFASAARNLVQFETEANVQNKQTPKLVVAGDAAIGFLPEPPPAPQRIGLFVGIGKYQSEASGGDFPAAANSAKAVYEAMKAHGALDVDRLLLDEQATRDQLESAITEWLPDQSRPGDTVILYLAGRGAQLSEEVEREEPDGKDEAIIPYDGDWGPSEDATERAQAARRSMIEDDILERWIDSLSGRRVALILDAPHSGGMIDDAEIARSLPRNAEKPPWQMAHQDLYVLTSALADGTPPSGGSCGEVLWMSDTLTHLIRHGKGELTVKDSFWQGVPRISTLLEQEQRPGNNEIRLFEHTRKDPRLSSSPVLAVGRKPGRAGLFIGIGKYEHFDDVPAYANSAKAMHDVMVQRGRLDPERTKLVLDEQATRENIKELMSHWLPIETAADETTFIYIAARGVQLKTGVAAEEFGGIDEALVPYDGSFGEGADDQRDQHARGTMILDDDFTKWIYANGSRNVVVTLDCSYAAGMFDRAEPGVKDRSEVVTRMPRGLTFAAAASPAAAAGHGGDVGDYAWFTKHLVDVLRESKNFALVDLAFDEAVNRLDETYFLADREDQFSQPFYISSSAERAWYIPEERQEDHREEPQ